MMKALQRCGDIAGLLLHESEIGPKLRHIRLYPHGLLVVVYSRGKVVRSLSLLGGSYERFKSGCRLLLAKPGYGFDQQNQQQQWDAVVQVPITSRTCRPTGQFCREMLL